MSGSEPGAVLVTGVSSGIGAATAALAARRGTRVFGSVRTEADAERLVRELGPDVVPLVFDVRDEGAVAAAADRVRRALGGRRLGGLVANAGLAIPGPALLQPMAEIREQIETDLIGQIVVARAFAPLLGTDPGLSGAPGRIILMSSIAGVIGQPFMSGYVAAKHGLEGFADSLRTELQLFGIEVVVVAPATVATPIWDKAEPHAGRYAGTPYADAFDRGVSGLSGVGKRHGLAPETVAELVWTALTTRRPRARYGPARHPVVEQVLARLLPRRALERLFGLALGLRPSR